MLNFTGYGVIRFAPMTPSSHPLRVFLYLVLASAFAGCATNNPHSEFVRSINITPFDTFAYKHTLISGFDWDASEKALLRETSRSVVTSALAEKGFEKVAAEEGPDITLVAKWRKRVSSYPGPFDHVDGFRANLDRRDEPGQRFAARLHLVVEAYAGEGGAETGTLFWRADLPNIFDAVQFTEERVEAALRRAVGNFPERVEKDPDLPTLR